MSRSLAIIGACALFFVAAACSDSGPASVASEDRAIHGIVVDPLGNPISDGEVTLLWPRSRKATTHSGTTTGFDGRFELTIPTNQAYRLWISAPGQKQIEAPVVITEDDVDGSLRAILPSVEADGVEAEIIWSPELTYLQEMALIRRLAKAESAEAMRSLYELLDPEMVQYLGSSDPILERERHKGIDPGSGEKTPKSRPPDPHAVVFATIEGLRTGGRSPFLAGIDEMSPTEILEIAPVESPLWGFAPNRLVMVIAAQADPRDDPETAAEVLNGVFESNPDRLVQGEALASLVFCANRSGDSELARELFERLDTHYGDLAELDVARSLFDPDAQVRAGVAAPDFSFSLTNGTLFSTNDLPGHWTLIDFWSIACGPCIGEMPQLHLAHDLFASRGLIMVSISIDRDPEIVASFRAERYAMPWLHAIPPDGDSDEGVKVLNPAGGVPWLFLVSPEGAIVATSEDLRRERLIPTLSRYLGVAESGPTVD